MAKIPVADIRNVAFCGHGAAGKTTLLDKILSLTGTDHPSGQRRRRHEHLRLRRGREVTTTTIEANVVHFDHGGKQFHAIDTPGYPDFIGQTIGAVQAVDTAVDRDQRPERASR